MLGVGGGGLPCKGVGNVGIFILEEDASPLDLFLSWEWSDLLLWCCSLLSEIDEDEDDDVEEVGGLLELLDPDPINDGGLGGIMPPLSPTVEDTSGLDAVCELVLAPLDNEEEWWVIDEEVDSILFISSLPSELLDGGFMSWKRSL